SAEFIETDYSARALGRGLKAVFNPQETSQSCGGNFSVINASGESDEVWFAAKKILALTEQGYDFSSIAVIARTLEPYRVRMENIFSENKIPFSSSMGVALSENAPAEFCMSLLSLARNNFSSSAVANVAGSPYFRYKKTGWDGIIRLSGAQGGIEQWRGLINFGNANISRDFEGKNGRQKFNLSAKPFLTWLAKTKTALNRLERGGRWEKISAFALKFIEDNINLSALSADDIKTFERVKNLISSAQIYGLAKNAGAEEFISEVCTLIRQEQLFPYKKLNSGVQVLDAMSARGQDFKAVILIGLNEKMFPRLIREDPMLLDAQRRFLRDGAGFWIWQKLEGYGEEKLLFYMAASCASEKLFCVFQRSDAEGKARPPSVYLAELCRACDVSLDDKNSVEHVPRSNIEKYTSVKECLLTEKEISLKFALAGLQDCYQIAGLENEDFKFLRQAARQISSSKICGGYDGFLGGAGDFLKEAAKKGFSPSALEKLSRCPMSYFFEYILGFRDNEEAFSRDALSDKLVGTLYHKAASLYYKNPQFPDGFNKAFAKVFPPKLSYGLYPLVWEVLREVTAERLKSLIDFDSAFSGGFKPKFFEREFSAVSDIGVKFHGRADRVDINEAEKTFRVIDYKKRLKAGKLETLVVRGENFQPFIYLEL
ncbi:MAG: exodeoxyribonuclease V subunit gamma, partial [Elusimicrobia bacterium]|nr:exodeoxyribonuclease V subunit gamma [Elusimicrobiota bacterium]